jgi:hypothetical protein
MRRIIMKPEVLALISALGGIFIATIGNVVISIFIKRNEYAREIKKLVVASAMEQWKEALSQARKDTIGPLLTNIAPVADFIIENSMLLDLIGKKNLDEKKIRTVIAQMKKVTGIFNEYNRQGGK